MADEVTRKVTDLQVTDGNAVVGVELRYRARVWHKSYRLKPGVTDAEFEKRVDDDARQLMAFRPIINRIGRVRKIKYDEAGLTPTQKAGTDGQSP